MVKKILVLCITLFVVFTINASEWIGCDDFATLSTNRNYKSGQTTNGWSFENCVINGGRTDKSKIDTNPFMSCIGGDSTRAITMNGKISAIGKISSPTIYGIDSITLNYSHLYSETVRFKDSISFHIAVKAASDSSILKEFDVKTTSEQKKIEIYSAFIHIKDSIFIEFSNNCPSQKDENCNRYAVWNIKWSEYEKCFNAKVYTNNSDFEYKSFKNKNDNNLKDNEIAIIDENIDSYLGRNVVTNYNHANCIILHNDKNLFIPDSIYADTIIFHYKPTIYASLSKGWQTIVLPFDATNFYSKDKEIKPFSNKDNYTNGDFWVKEIVASTEDSIIIRNIEEPILRAGKPYLIAFPGNHYKEYSLENNDEIIFSSNNTWLYKDAENIVETEYYNFEGSFYEKEKNNIYVLNTEMNLFEKKETKTIKPFSAFLSGKSELKSLYIKDEDNKDEVIITKLNTSKADKLEISIYYKDGKTYIYSQDSNNLDIYMLNGKVLKNVTIEQGENEIDFLNKGTYIINNRKIIIK